METMRYFFAAVEALWAYIYIYIYICICICINHCWIKRRDICYSELHNVAFIRHNSYTFSQYLSKSKQKIFILNINPKYSHKHQFVLSFLFTLHNSNLFWCLHLLTSSNLLLSNFLPLRDLMFKNFSIKHDLQ